MNKDHLYEGRSFNVVIGVLQGVLLIPFTFCSLQPIDVFSLDGKHTFQVSKSIL